MLLKPNPENKCFGCGGANERGMQLVFEQDDADDRAAVDQARRLLQQAKDQLANLQSPGKPTEIAQAQANLRDAEAARVGRHPDPLDLADLFLEALHAAAAHSLAIQPGDHEDAFRRAHGLVFVSPALRGVEAGLEAFGEFAPSFGVVRRRPLCVIRVYLAA